jgi:single-strand DNA-binding protein
MTMPLPHTVVDGGLVGDPELRFGSDGKPWLTCRVACADSVRDANGNWTDGPTTFIEVIAFGKPAEHFAESVSRGDQVVVVGTLEQNDYETREGEKRTTYRVKARSLAVSTRFRPAKTDRTISGEVGTDKAASSWG